MKTSLLKGSQGGLATFKKYGSDHFSKIGKRGYKKMLEKKLIGYRIIAKRQSKQRKER